MVQTCTKCSRANPEGAAYCYHDGVALGGGRRAGPVAVGRQPFANPFVFPDGRTCRNYDELALACQEKWADAADLLQQGFLETFLAGLGRHDLAAAAKEAARFPDRARGLDQLLTKLPTEALDAPKLRVDPLEINLGQLAVGADRTLELHLENQGMRLVYGSVDADDCVWLALGEPPGAAEKHFEFTHELTVPVRVRGDRLRAHPKPLEGRLLVESNGGTATVQIRAEVPVTPFPNGALAGAKSPRQLAEKCQANPKAAAALFEAGAVERWYAANGWTYPVKVPAASGLAAVQQFYEALGLTKPPKVEVSHKAVALRGDPGAALRLEVEVSSAEKRPVYAHAVSDVPWLEVGRPRANGRVARLPLAVPAVPNRPGEKLSGKLTIQSNGGQRFVVPVTLEVGGATLHFARPEPPVEAVAAPRARQARRVPAWVHAIPAVLLGLAVLGVVAFDLRRPRGGDDDPEGLRVQRGWRYDLSRVAGKDPLLGLGFSEDQRFGLVSLGEKDPRPKYKDKWKRLTADEHGGTNNTVLLVGGFEYRFGFDTPDNVWYRGRRHVELPEPRLGRISDMLFTRGRVRVTQHVEVVPGTSDQLDTCLVYYRLKNYGRVPQKVGLRSMIDTYIGANDGVPFLVPGRKELLRGKEDFAGGAVPDYLEAIEKPDDPSDPGTTVRVGLKGLLLPGVELEDPVKVRVSRYPGNANVGWDWPPEPMTDPGAKEASDSCVALYWDYREMAPGEERHLAFTYGLSKLDVGGQLALSAPAWVPPNKEFVVTAYVWSPEDGQKVTLQVPDGLTLLGDAAQTVEGGGARTQVAWRVRAGGEGRFTLEAHSNRSRATRAVAVKKSSIFG